MPDSLGSIKKLYALTCLVGALGFVSYFWAAGVRSAIAFALGAACSLGNLWVFDRLSASITPSADSRKPWLAGTYITRYILLIGAGYTIVKALNVSPLAVILGLLASTVAVLTSLIVELVLSALRGQRRTE